MSERIHLHSDNILIHNGRKHGEFMSISFWQIGSVPYDEIPFTVTLSRYVLPGRLDLYNFAYLPGRSGHHSRICYGHDSCWSLAKAARQVEKDLRLPQVAQLISDFGRQWPKLPLQHLLMMLDEIGPRTLSANRLRKAIQAARERHRALATVVTSTHTNPHARARHIR